MKISHGGSLTGCSSTCPPVTTHWARGGKGAECSFIEAPLLKPVNYFNTDCHQIKWGTLSDVCCQRSYFIDLTGRWQGPTGKGDKAVEKADGKGLFVLDKMSNKAVWRKEQLGFFRAFYSLLFLWTHATCKHPMFVNVQSPSAFKYLKMGNKLALNVFVQKHCLSTI